MHIFKNFFFIGVYIDFDDISSGQSEMLLLVITGKLFIEEVKINRNIILLLSIFPFFLYAREGYFRLEFLFCIIS